ncbi:carbohydrate ABC transporter permease [Bacillus sp. ISL-40]|uniref:carbohydrate ABC transporter permease n=1 Tax=unclassified Bacillus (in: firmicutes) TaxID=185979 RepID=UPI001BEC0BF7|nr:MULTISPECIES: carbohydrate ABC transporter permease [unclassified Bacillus (in: firmicutes)]MBT2700456.1 carbohydrate ABC transporter permease [Bacillus sp. ISL-40]MBT2720484.1 carbohydrate ABC transporter permease [Bacillus sp. ISL-46]MBT2744239.1 carbohydrate ABC transporter permease [Bacillus sp. ISL-77]
MSKVVINDLEAKPIVTKHSNGKRYKKLWKLLFECFAVVATLGIFGIPFYFVIINAFKDVQESSLLNMDWPSSYHIIENLQEVIYARDGMILRAFYNSVMITGLSIILLILLGAAAGYVLQRKVSKVTPFINFLILAGLIIPPAVVPTIWVLQEIGLFKTMPGIVLVEVALNLPFTIILYRGFMVTIPKSLDEAALIDGCGRFRLFFHIILPLLKPVSATVIVLTAVSVYNDFVNPLYFFPGAENATLQLTLYNFMSMYITKWNLLFTNILVISIPPLILFIIFNKKIVAGMTAGSVK